MATLLDRGDVQQILPKFPVLQQMPDHRFPFSRFEPAESRVQGIGCLSDDVCHVAKVLASKGLFNADVSDDRVYVRQVTRGVDREKLIAGLNGDRPRKKKSK